MVHLGKIHKYKYKIHMYNEDHKEEVDKNHHQEDGHHEAYSTFLGDLEVIQFNHHNMVLINLVNN